MLAPGHKHSDVYRQAVILAKELYHITEGFPDGERAALVYTLRRLAVLLCQNIALAGEKRGKKGRRLLEACVEHCVAIDVQLEIAIAVQLLPHEKAGEAARLLQLLYKQLAQHSRKGV